jgi:CheY-like chemotaxis protein
VHGVAKSFSPSRWGWNNGQKAVDLLRESTPGMRLILMDLRMPVMDGLMRLQSSRKNSRFRYSRACLRQTQADVKSQCEEIGFVEYCVKPTKKDQLLVIIEEYTGYQYK